MKNYTMLSLAVIALWAVAATGQPSHITDPQADPASAETVALEIPAISGVIVGDVIEVPIAFTGTLDGLGILSYQLNLTYNQSRIAIVGLKNEGTASESMASVLGNEASPGNYHIAAAGTEPLEGGGPLLILEVELLSSGWSHFNFGPAENNYFNEGNPAMSTTNGSINISPRPALAINPVLPALARGDEQQFSVAGNPALPIQWSVSDEAIGTINEQGLLSVAGYGRLQVFATDADGISGQTNPFTVHPFRIRAAAVEQYPGFPATMSVQVTSMDDLDVIAGSFAIEHSAIGTVVTYVGIERGGLLPNADLAIRRAGNRLEVAFASRDVLQGEGELLRLIFHTEEERTANTVFHFTNVVFNESLTGLPEPVPFRIQPPPPLQVRTSATTVMSGQALAFTVEGHQGEVQWSVDDPRLGTISEEGVFSAVTGGKTRISVVDEVGARGSSPEISIYDYDLRIEPLTAVRGQPVRIPVTIGNTEGAIHEVVSMEGELLLPAVFENPTVEIADGVVSDWMLTQNKDGNVIHIALAGSAHIQEDGSLLHITGTLRNDLAATRYLFQFRDLVMNQGGPVPNLERNWLTVLTDFPMPPGLIEPQNQHSDVLIPLSFRWGSVTGATSYRFELSADEQFPSESTHVEILSGTRFDMNTLATGTTYYWRVKTIIDQVESEWSDVWTFTTKRETAAEDEGEVPGRMYLYQNYPNPFNPGTQIRFTLPEQRHVRLSVFNILGQEIAILANEILPAGWHDIPFDAGGLSSGVYLYRLEADGHVKARQMILAK